MTIADHFDPRRIVDVLDRHHRRGLPLAALTAVVRGAGAGAVGLVAMDLLWYARYRRGGGDNTFVDWEFSTDISDWDNAPAPAQFGKRLIEGIFRRNVPADRAGLVNNVMHWATGVGWGAVFGLVSGSLGIRQPWRGLVFGTTVWVQSYAVLVPAKLYKPPWEYDLQTLWKDLSAHLVYGLTTTSAFRLWSIIVPVLPIRRSAPRRRRPAV